MIQDLVQGLPGPAQLDARRDLRVGVDGRSRAVGRWLWAGRSPDVEKAGRSTDG